MSGANSHDLRGTVSGGIQHRAKAMIAEKLLEIGLVFGVESSDPRADQPPGPRGSDADDLPGEAVLEVVQGAVTSNAGDARNE